ncbi:molybdate ABC transporter permease [Aliidongia dinghuensis]|uniref:Molybdenum transport system permease n=1 Tax=Aliidongia dinghuensis TaxID=1867774 RepID=A0A8J3E5Z8_9PROT|nr:molybdate ABC transporter permease subunit [Aliidongia dinghuensis]GGF51638.1 molybdate ABC transporter permease [Aliidongia dinghuensis]
MPFLTPLEAEAFELSLRIGVWSAVVSLPPALAVAWALARGRFRGRLLLSAIIHLPLVLPPVVTGYALLLLFGRHGPIGAWLESWFGLVFAFRWTGAALAAGVMSFPLVVRALQLSIEAIDPGLEQAAATLGARPILVFLTVTLPLIVPGLLAGALLGFAKSLGEFGATITFVSNIPGETRTLPIAIYSLLQVPGTDAAVLRLSLLSVAVSVVAVFGSELVARRLRRRAAGA